MKVTVSGTVLRPTTSEGRSLPPTSFLNLSGGTQYTWGDGAQGGSDGGAVSCEKSTKRTTDRETYEAESHLRPGTYLPLHGAVLRHRRIVRNQQDHWLRQIVQA